MPTINELRSRSQQIFESLVAAPAAAALAGGQVERFSWFDPDQAQRAVILSAQIGVQAASHAALDVGLAAALDTAEAAAATEPAELVNQALAMFVTHNTAGRNLIKPRLAAIQPARFAPSPRAAAAGATGREVSLDYWREDALANEHHTHWHQVYPYTGLAPSDWQEWAATLAEEPLIGLLDKLDPSSDWATIVPTLAPSQRADALISRLAQFSGEQFGIFLRNLPPHLYPSVFRLNDRQGELFFYMHAQMLARYDAERHSHDLPPVVPFGPTAWSQPIPEGYDPGTLEPPYGSRIEGAQLSDDALSELNQLHAELDTAVVSGELDGAAGSRVAVDRVTLGEATEAADPRLRPLSLTEYEGVHNVGHGEIAALSTEVDGVMSDTSVAIRDPIFWRWHRYIDDLNARWQDAQPSYDFADAPAVTIRNDLTAGTELWSSPDLILVPSAQFEASDDRTALANAAFAGVGWDTDYGSSNPDPAGVQVTDTLVTRLVSTTIAGQPATYLTHEPFGYALRIDNPGNEAIALTVRAFLTVADPDDRRNWIELDKSAYLAPPGRSVLYRPDTKFSVIKKPAEADHGELTGGGGDPQDTNYCDCGWPYTLLLPRGTTHGLAANLAVLCTDVIIDNVAPAGECGSISFCGAVDRYPDSRDMGYPFSRPFAVPIGETIRALTAAAGRSMVVRHEP